MASLIGIELATRSHTQAIVKLDSEVLGSSMREDFLIQAVEAGQVWAAFKDAMAVGFVVLTESFFHYPFIELLIVHPGLRRHGIGSRLMMEAELHVSVEKLFTSTNASNSSMQRLCESLGFIRSGTIENLDDGDNEIVYFKRVRASRP